MKNIFILLVILIFLVSFCGCAGGKLKVGEKEGKAAASMNFPIGN